MTQLPGEDRQLVRFLRQYRPGGPGVSAELESEIMEQVLRSVPAPQRRFPLWLLSSAVVASGLMSWVSYQLLTPSESSLADLGGWELLVPGSWESVISVPSESLEFNTNPSLFWKEVSGMEKRYFEQH